MTVDVSRPQIMPMLTVLEAAALLGLQGTDRVKTRQVQRLAHKGKLPGAVWIGRTLRFRVIEFKAFVEGKDNVFSAMRKAV